MTRTRNRLPVGLTVLIIVLTVVALVSEAWLLGQIHGGQQ